MEKYKRFCRVCCGPLDRKYSLVLDNGQLSTVGLALAHELDISAEGGPSYACGSCYRWVLALKKMEEDVEAKKRALRDKLAAATTFFSLSKRVTTLSSPVQHSPSSAARSPAAKRSKESSAKENTRFARALFPSGVSTLLSVSAESEQVVHRTQQLQPRTRSPEKSTQSVERPSRIPRLRSGITPLPHLRPKVELGDLESIIDDECSKLCSPDRTVFRTMSITDFAGFNWNSYERELKEISPTLWAVLKAAATSLNTHYKRKTPSSTVPTCVVAASALLKERNMHMAAIQHLLSLLLWHGNSSTMVSIHCVLHNVFVCNCTDYMVLLLYHYRQ